MLLREIADHGFTRFAVVGSSVEAERLVLSGFTARPVARALHERTEQTTRPIR